MRRRRRKRMMADENFLMIPDFNYKLGGTRNSREAEQEEEEEDGDTKRESRHRVQRDKKGRREKGGV